MTSINFERNQILCSGMEGLPNSCGEGCVLLITAGLDDLSEVEVSKAELKRSFAMESMTARRFLAARRVARGMFSKFSGIPSQSIGLELDANGKPFLAGMDYHFSIAHSGETVAVALSRLEVGVDLETEREIDIPALARRFFSSEEAVFLTENPDPAHFFRLWTCREAAAKADGRGLAKLLGQTKVATEWNFSGQAIDVSIGDQSWIACHWPERGGLHLALAYRKLPSLISWCDLRSEFIL